MYILHRQKLIGSAYNKYTRLDKEADHKEREVDQWHCTVHKNTNVHTEVGTVL